MVLARWQSTITDEAGNIQSAASVEVRREVAGSPLALLYSDRNGLVSTGNPITADSEGFAAFHVAGGAYRITATKGGFSRVWRYVGIGRAQEFDATDIAALVQQVDAGYALTFESETSAPPSVGAIRFNNADLSAATEAYVSTENLGGSNIELRLLELFSALRTVKDTFAIADPASNAQASWQIDGATLVGSPGDYVTLTISEHAGETSFTDDERVNFQANRAGADGEDGQDGSDGDVVTSGAVVEGQVTEYASATGGTIRGATEEGSPTEPLLSSELVRGPSLPTVAGQIPIYADANGRRLAGANEDGSPTTPILAEDLVLGPDDGAEIQDEQLAIFSGASGRSIRGALTESSPTEPLTLTALLALITAAGESGGGGNDWTYAAEVATTSGSSVTLASGIPAGVSEIEVFFDAVSDGSADSTLEIRIGDSDGIENTGYIAKSHYSTADQNSTSGFPVVQAAGFDAADQLTGVVRLCRYDDSGTRWFSSGITLTIGGNARVYPSTGQKTLSGVLTQLQLVAGGTFDNGAVRVRYR